MIACPAAMRQASRMSSRLMLSSSTIFAPAASASCNSASDSTSIWMNLQPGPAAAWAAAIACAMPPPHFTAYFCASRRPGIVFRVSTTTAFVPATTSAYWRALVATPESSCRKLRPLRSAESRARALPSISQSSWSLVTRSPSAACQESLTCGSMRRNTLSNQAVPQSTASSREITVARPIRSSGMRPAVKSPGPISSASAALTLRSISSAGGRDAAKTIAFLL